MTTGPEKQFENEIKKFLKTLTKTWFFKVWSGPYSKSGIPDIIGIVNGHFIALEVKAENGHPTELQKLNITLIKQAGGYARIVYPKDFEILKGELLELSRKE